MSSPKAQYLARCPLFDRQEASNAAKSGLNFVGYEQRPILAAELLGAREVTVVGYVHALALNGFDYECSHLACRQGFIQRSEIIERNLGAVRQQRTESIAKIVVAVQRQRPIGEAMEGVRAVHQPRAAGSVAREFHRRLDRFFVTVSKEYLVEIRHVSEQLLRQDASQW